MKGSGSGGPSLSWTGRAWQAALVLLATALGGRLAWELLKPLVPGLVVVVVLTGVVSLALRGRRY